MVKGIVFMSSAVTASGTAAATIQTGDTDSDCTSLPGRSTGPTQTGPSSSQTAYVQDERPGPTLKAVPADTKRLGVGRRGRNAYYDGITVGIKPVTRSVECTKCQATSTLSGQRTA